MASSRYKNIEVQRNEDRERVYKSTMYPEIKNSRNDIYIEAEVGDRLDKLAQQFYSDKSLWWIIAQANNLGKGSFYVEPGTRIRIPRNVSEVYTDLERINERR